MSDESDSGRAFSGTAPARSIGPRSALCLVPDRARAPHERAWPVLSESGHARGPFWRLELCPSAPEAATGRRRAHDRCCRGAAASRRHRRAAGSRPIHQRCSADGSVLHRAGHAAARPSPAEVLASVPERECFTRRRVLPHSAFPRMQHFGIGLPIASGRRGSYGSAALCCRSCSSGSRVHGSCSCAFGFRPGGSGPIVRV